MGDLNNQNEKKESQQPDANTDQFNNIQPQNQQSQYEDQSQYQQPQNQQSQYEDQSQFQQPQNQQTQYGGQSQYQQPQNQQPQYGDQSRNQQAQNQQTQYTGQPQYQKPQNQQPQYGDQSKNQQPQYQQPQYSGESQHQQNYYQYQQPEPKKTDPLSIVSVICGGVSFLFCCLSFFTWMSAVAGIITGIISLNRNKENNYENKNDKVLSIIGIVLSGLGLLVAILILVSSIVYKDIFVQYLNNYSSY